MRIRSDERNTAKLEWDLGAEFGRSTDPPVDPSYPVPWSPVPTVGIRGGGREGGRAVVVVAEEARLYVHTYGI